MIVPTVSAIVKMLDRLIFMLLGVGCNEYC